MDETLSKTLRGTMAQAWIQAEGVVSSEPQPGYIQRDKNGRLELSLIVDADLNHKLMFDDNDPIPEAAAAATEHAGVVLFDITGMRRSSNFGGSKISTRHFSFRACAVNVALEHVKFAAFRSTSILIPGLYHWAQMAGSEEAWESDENALTQTFQVRLTAAPPETTRLAPGLTLSLDTHWGVTGELDRRTLYAPVQFTVDSDRPRPWQTLVLPLFHAHQLMSVAFEAFVPSDGGFVIFEPSTVSNTSAAEGASEGPAAAAPRRCPWWSQRLMEAPAGQSATPRLDFPLFSLKDLGGAAGIGRWTRLVAEHPRATAPLTTEFYSANLPASVKLVEVAIAIEYYVAAHRRTRAWTKRGATLAEALALHVGSNFTEWVDDVSKWATRFTEIYNLLKHNPAADIDAHEIRLYAASARMLLICALMNRVAGTKAPAISALGGHRGYQLGQRLRDLR